MSNNPFDNQQTEGLDVYGSGDQREYAELELETDPKQEKILWSCITRNKTILAEAGSDPFEGAVSEAAHGILNKRSTPGWEYYTLKNGDGWFGSSTTSSLTRKSFKANTDPDARALSSEETKPQRVPKLKAVKFHVFEHDLGAENGLPNREDDDGFGANKSDGGERKEPTVWVFAAVYNPEAISWRGSRHQLNDVQSFLEKIAGLTQMPRETDPAWRTGDTLACQASFAPILLQRMQEVTYLGQMARLTETLDGATEMMQNNISAILEREEKLDALQERSGKLQDMASVFQRNSKAVRRRMMMQNAKYGAALGAAVTVGVAVVVVPPLIAIL